MWYNRVLEIEKSTGENMSKAEKMQKAICAELIRAELSYSEIACKLNVSPVLVKMVANLSKLAK